MSTITEKDREIVQKVTDYLNNTCCDKTAFCRAMNQEHRFLQQEFTGLCIRWLQFCASDEYQFDDRNAYSRVLAQELYTRGLI